MKYFILLRESLRYVVRSRLLYLVLAFSFGLHFLGLKTLKAVTVNVQGMVSSVGPREGIFVSLFFSLFMGTFVSVVYGIWMVPYQHQGPRSQLTFVLPLSKWLYPAVYGTVHLILMLIEFAILFLSFGAIYGWGELQGSYFSWPAVLTCLSIELLAFWFFLFAFSFFSMTVGQVTTFFIGVMSFFMLQVAGAGFRLGLEEYGHLSGNWESYHQIYRLFPPMGELIFNLKTVFSKGTVPVDHLVSWVVWILVFVLLFRWKLRFPIASKSTE